MNEHYSLVFKYSFSILIHVNWFNKKKAALVKRNNYREFNFVKQCHYCCITCADKNMYNTNYVFKLNLNVTDGLLSENRMYMYIQSN